MWNDKCLKHFINRGGFFFIDNKKEMKENVFFFLFIYLLKDLLCQKKK